MGWDQHTHVLVVLISLLQQTNNLANIFFRDAFKAASFRELCCHPAVLIIPGEGMRLPPRIHSYQYVFPVVSKKEQKRNHRNVNALLTGARP